MKSLVAVISLVAVVILAAACGGGGESGIQSAGKIAFVSDRDGNMEIYLMNADGSQQVNLTDSDAEDTDPSWSPDGERIVFVSESGIYTIKTDGSGLMKLTSRADDPLNRVSDDSPAWSPDGERIVFGSSARIFDVEQGFVASDIYVMDADGSNITRLTEHPEDDVLPAWSPDGTRIAFFSDRDGAPGLFIMEADGSNQTLLVETVTDARAITWSPDGGRIAFALSAGGSAIHIVDLDDASVIRIAEELDNSFDPAWSPDGERIAFMSGLDHPPEIYVVNADGSGPTRLTNNDAFDAQPAWSPVP